MIGGIILTTPIVAGWRSPPADCRSGVICAGHDPAIAVVPFTPSCLSRGLVLRFHQIADGVIGREEDLVLTKAINHTICTEHRLHS